MIILLISVSLSMDAFSLSLLYGTLNLNKKDILSLSVIVSLYHFFMPLLGLLIGNTIDIHSNIIVFIILTIIGLQMIFSKNNNDIHVMSLKEKMLFGLAVSLDSFSVGIALNTIGSNYLISSSFFASMSFIFTLLGLLLGKKISNNLGRLAHIIGGVMLIIIGIIYIFK